MAFLSLKNVLNADLTCRFLDGQMLTVDGTVYVFGGRGNAGYSSSGSDDSVSTPYNMHVHKGSFTLCHETM